LVPLASTLSRKQAVAELGEQGAAPPRFVRTEAYPTAGYAELYEISAVAICRTELAAEDSLAAILARKRLGIAIAAMIKIIATTIRSSISEKPSTLSPERLHRLGCFLVIRPSRYIGQVIGHSEALSRSAAIHLLNYSK
jgi:hypothetical protein